MIKAYDVKIPELAKKISKEVTGDDIRLFLNSESSTAEILVKSEKAASVYQRYRTFVVRNGLSDKVQVHKRQDRVFLSKIKEDTQ